MPDNKHKDEIMEGEPEAKKWHREVPEWLRKELETAPFPSDEEIARFDYLKQDFLDAIHRALEKYRGDKSNNDSPNSR